MEGAEARSREGAANRSGRLPDRGAFEEAIVASTWQQVVAFHVLQAEDAPSDPARSGARIAGRRPA
jgi:hypothetical protein